VEMRAQDAGKHQDLAHAILESIPDGVLHADASGELTYLNPAAARLTGWVRQDACGRPFHEILRLEDSSSRNPLWSSESPWIHRDEEILDLTAVLVRPDGGEMLVRVTGAPLRTGDDGPAEGAVFTVKDVTELQKVEQEMRYLASHDPLTGLFNRREFEKRLELLVARSRRTHTQHALCYFDLDDFKVVNDTCGHIAGDAMLQQIAERLSHHAGPADLLARLGGDEFALLLSETEIDDAQKRAQKLIADLEAFRFQWNERIFSVGASVGLVAIGDASGNGIGVLAAADAACYAAKERGRNLVQVYQMDDTAIGRRHGEMLWVQRLHHALEEDRFRLYSQEIRPIGRHARPYAELFIRLVDSFGQVWEPGVFIPAAERYHLIHDIDRWVIRNAFRVLAHRCEADERTFTLNISGQSLGDRDFLGFVLQELGSSGVDPECLCFELTETAAISHMAQAREFFAVLRDKGCCFGLDDFGSGLSSFAYLRDLPVDLLKIDGSFVRQVLTDPVSRELIKAIREVAKVLDIPTVAEGVESRELLETLQEIGIDYVQGYFIERPGPMVTLHETRPIPLARTAVG
jgi:diguanylate cyclase (GGDEF)-like protein/PAS domain S-box-containing protein